MEPNRFIRILRRSWVLITAFVVLGVLSGGVAAVLTPVQYASATRLFVTVQIAPDATTGDLVQGNNFAVQKVLSYVDVVTSPRVLDPVITELGLDTTAEDLSRDIVASVQPNSVIIEIDATADTAADAAALAGATADSFADVVVNELETPADGSASPVKVEVLQPAVEPTDPSLPQIPFNLALGLLIGLVVGVILALIIGLLDRRIHGRVDLARITDLPIIGSISANPRMRKRPLVVRDDTQGLGAESYRVLRTNLQSVGFEGGARSLVSTSSVRSEGKSVNVANLAVSLAEAGSRVLVVDADLRNPRISSLFSVPSDRGLTDVLTRRVSLDDAFQSVSKRLTVLPSGTAPSNPSELLGSAEMATLLEALTQRFDYVLIDAPPVLPVTDAAVLSRLTGATVLTVAAGKVRDDEVLAAIEMLDDAGGTVIGIVVTMVASRGPDAGVSGGRPVSSPRGARRRNSAVQAGAASDVSRPRAATATDSSPLTSRAGLRGRDGVLNPRGVAVTADRDPRLQGGV